MSKLALLAVVLVCVIAAACGRNPDARTADWEENFNRVNRATASGQHDQAIAIAEAFLKKHPDNVDGHQMVGAALRDAGRAASNATRPARFEQAVTHYTRALELTKNPTWRLRAISNLVLLHSVEELNNPDAAARYARMQVADNPRDINSYGNLLPVLREARKYEEAMSALAQAKGAMEPNADELVTYARFVHRLVISPEFPRDAARTLLAETAALIEQSLSKYGRTEKLLRIKAALLRAQSDVEPDPTRQRALWEQSSRTFDELDRIAK